MDPKWIHILVILVSYQKFTSGAVEDKLVKEGHQVEIRCQLNDTPSMIVWFRMLDNSGMQFIASFSNGVRKQIAKPFTDTFSDSKIRQHILTLKSFKEYEDSGVYVCASLNKGTDLVFGKATRLVADKPKGVDPTPPTSAKQSPCTTGPACNCPNSNVEVESSLSLLCAPIILGPLAGGCGLLLLLLIVTILYCNRVRTRRCPHHYKRKPRTMAAGKQMPTNRPY